MAAIFEATEISGVTDPGYPSAATNKHYVDNISSAIMTNITSTYLPSSLLPSWFDGLYAPTGAGGLTQNQADAYYHPSGHGIFANISTSRYLTHTEDPYSKLDFQNNQLDVIVGDMTMFTMVSGNAYGVIVNSGNKDIDFDVRGKTVTDLFHIDAGADTVGVGTAGGLTHIFNVNGTGYFSGRVLANVVQSTYISTQNISGGSFKHDGVIYVGKHGSDAYNGLSMHRPFLTIASGINYAGTIATSTNPVTVYVFNGTYDESPFTISSNVTLKGQSRDGTIIKNTDASVNPLITLNSNTSINNCYIMASGTDSQGLGPHFSDTNRVYLDNVRVYATLSCINARGADTTCHFRNSVFSNLHLHLESESSTEAGALVIRSSGGIAFNDYEPVIIKDSYVYAHKTSTAGHLYGIQRIGNDDSYGVVEILNCYVLAESAVSANVISLYKTGVGESIINGCTFIAKTTGYGKAKGVYNDGTYVGAHSMDVTNCYCYGYSPSDVAVGLYNFPTDANDINKFFNCTFLAETDTGHAYDIQNGWSIATGVVNPYEYANCSFRATAVSSATTCPGAYFKQSYRGFMPPMTFNVASIAVSAQQNINLVRFTCPPTKRVYLWQAAASDTNGNSVGELYIELLSGSTTVYKTSSNIVQSGLPLASSQGGATEIRFMYSGASAAGIKYGTGFMNISVM